MFMLGVAIGPTSQKYGPITRNSRPRYEGDGVVNAYLVPPL